MRGEDGKGKAEMRSRGEENTDVEFQMTREFLAGALGTEGRRGAAVVCHDLRCPNNCAVNFTLGNRKRNNKVGPILAPAAAVQVSRRNSPHFVTV